MKYELRRLDGNQGPYYLHSVPETIKYPYPLLLNHGMGGNLIQFELATGFLLEKGFEVYALNLETTKGCSSINDYVANHVAMLKHIGRPTITVNHSMGALIGQKVAALLSQETPTGDGLVKAAVFMSSSPPKGIRLFLKEMLWPRYMVPMFTDKTFHILPKHVRRIMMNKTPDVEHYLDQVGAISGRALREIALGEIDVNERDVKCPTLVLSPDGDLTGRPKMQEKIAQKYNSDFVSIPGDHFAFMWSEEAMRQVVGWIHYKGLHLTVTPQKVRRVAA